MLTSKTMPYCPGCGHRTANICLDKAIEASGLSSNDLIIVSDIGCCGLIDPLMKCHTIHGLHGRSPALALGVALGLKDSRKKIIAVLGDGGATIGLQHILECARRNVNMTVLILNNLIYGMTGGQISGLSSSQFKLERHTIEENIPHYDIIRLAHEAGAAYTSRILSHRDYESSLVEAIEKKGFSLVEIIGLCQPYGLHKNKEISATGYEELHLDQDRQAFELYETEKPSLFADLKGVRTISKHSLNEPISIVIAGAAGEGVQYAARLLANAAMSVGLHVSLKGEYPITVGTGFSIAEVILSPCEIRYTGIEIPDVLIVTAKEGRDRVAGRYIDVPYLVQDKDTAELPAKVKLRASFRAVSGPKDAVLSAIAYWIRKNKVLPLDVLYQAVKGQKHEDKLRATLNKTAQLP